MATQLNTNDYRFINAQNLLDDIANNEWYFFVGDHITHSNSILQDISDNPYQQIQSWENMIMGKAIGSNNVNLMVRNYPWQANTVYAMYDDKDTNLINENFFINEPEGDFSHFWKCLDNNDGAASLIQPTVAAISSPYLQTSDGYRWKYMSSVDSGNVSNFSTSDYIPIYANDSVQAVATNGSIDIIVVENAGALYNNYLDGTFGPTDVLSSTIFKVANNQAVKINGYYTGCIMYFSGGTGAGQFTQIIDYVSNTSGTIIQTANSFVIPPDNTTQYQIRPAVQVVGSGTETVNCIARALINSTSGNSVYRTEVLQSGLDYLDASAAVIANVVVGVSNTATVRPILPPRGGHGFDVFEELYCNSVGVYVFLSNTENGTLPVTNFYQQIGLIRNPTFANVNVTTVNTNGIFQNTETICAILFSQLNINCTANGTTMLSCNTANLFNQLVADDFVYITSLDGSRASLNQVETVINSTAVEFTTNCQVIDTSAIMYNVEFTGNAICTFGGTNSIFVNNCPSSWQSGTTLVGASSGAAATVLSLTRNDIAKSFNTFIQLYKYVGTSIGAFIPNELVISGNTTAVLFDVANSNTVFQVSNFNNSNGIFGNSGSFTGVDSGAIATISGNYSPELVYRSGDLMYLQNIDPVTRTNNQIETFQFILNF